MRVISLNIDRLKALCGLTGSDSVAPSSVPPQSVDQTVSEVASQALDDLQQYQLDGDSYRTLVDKICTDTAFSPNPSLRSKALGICMKILLGKNIKPEDRDAIYSKIDKCIQSQAATVEGMPLTAEQQRITREIGLFISRVLALIPENQRSKETIEGLLAISEGLNDLKKGRLDECIWRLNECSSTPINIASLIRWTASISQHILETHDRIDLLISSAYKLTVRDISEDQQENMSWIVSFLVVNMKNSVHPLKLDEVEGLIDILTHRSFAEKLPTILPSNRDAVSHYAAPLCLSSFNAVQNISVLEAVNRLIEQGKQIVFSDLKPVLQPITDPHQRINILNVVAGIPVSEWAAVWSKSIPLFEGVTDDRAYAQILRVVRDLMKVKGTGQMPKAKEAEDLPNRRPEPLSPGAVVTPKAAEAEDVVSATGRQPETVSEVVLANMEKLWQEGLKKLKPDLQEVTGNDAEKLAALEKACKSILQPELRAIAQRTSALWDCIGRKRNPSGEGFIYEFRLKKEYDYVTHASVDEAIRKASEKRYEAIFPAVEPVASESLLIALNHDCPRTDEFLEAHIDNVYERFTPANTFAIYLYPRSSIAQSVREQVGKIKILAESFHRLGYEAKYKDDGVHLHLPDREALVANWEVFRASPPANIAPRQLSRLDVVTSEGIADDMEYVESYFSHDVLLSSGAEFIHDHFAHVVPALRMMLGNESGAAPVFKQERLKAIKMVAAEYRKMVIAEEQMKDKGLEIDPQTLSLLKEAKALVGAFADSISSLSEAPLAISLQTILATPNWRKYFAARFPENLGPGDKINSFIYAMDRIVSEFDQLRKRWKKK